MQNCRTPEPLFVHQASDSCKCQLWLIINIFDKFSSYLQRQLKMKRYFVMTIIALAVFSDFSYGRDNTNDKPEKLIREFRENDGFHSISLGRLGTGLAKGILKMVLTADSNEEALKVYNCFDKISSVRLTVYEECDDCIRNNFNRRMSSILNRYELLMEIKDGKDRISLFSGSGAYYMFIPKEGVMIRFTGKINTEELMKIAIANV